MTDVPILEPLDMFDIDSAKGVLTLFVVAAPYEMDRAKPEIIGCEVEVLGRRWRVMAADRFLPATPIRRGENISILCEPIKEAK